MHLPWACNTNITHQGTILHPNSSTQHRRWYNQPLLSSTKLRTQDSTSKDTMVVDTKEEVVAEAVAVAAVAAVAVATLDTMGTKVPVAPHQMAITNTHKVPKQWHKAIAHNNNVAA